MTKSSARHATAHDLDFDVDARIDEYGGQDEIQAHAGAEADSSPPRHPPEPSWFVRNYGTQSPEDLAKEYQSKVPVQPVAPADDPYASYRQRLEERFRLAQKMADPRFGGGPAPHAHTPGKRATRHVPQPPQAATGHTPTGLRGAGGSNLLGVKPATALLLTALACGAGSAGGYLMANPQSLSALASLSLSDFGNMLGTRSEQPRSLTVVNKPIMSAEVKVADVTGPINSPIPLDISAETQAGGPPIALLISGLPQDAYLTAGTPAKEGEWMLRPEDLRNAQLVIQKSDRPELGLLVTAIDTKTGDVAAPVKTMRVALDLNAVPPPGLQPPKESAEVSRPVVTVTPAAAQPDQTLPQPVPPPLNILKSEASSFLEKGDMLLKAGDIIGARQFYLQAYELQSPEGAYGIGQTYDPAVYAALNVRGLTPNAAKALEWYGKAAAAGHAGAAAKLLVPPQ